MSNSFKEVTHQSWFGRIGGAIKGIFFGLLLIVIGTVLLFWNEGRAVKTHKALVESQNLVISINSESWPADANDKLVHIIGKANTTEILSDNLLPASINGLKLKRLVETYQWEETSKSEEKKNLGGSTDTVTTYSYREVWSDQVIDSSKFKQPAGHENPSDLLYQNKIWVAENIYIGAISLSNHHKSEINAFQQLALPASVNLPKGVSKQGEGLYVGKNPSKPKIGDQRISFLWVQPQIYSAIGHLLNAKLMTHMASNGRTIGLITAGEHTANAMFEQAKSANATLTWILRAAGTFILVIAFSMILKPLSVLADVVPFIGNIIEIGTGFVSLLVGLVIALVVISIAWIFYRPFIGLALLLAVAALLYLLKRRTQQAAETLAQKSPTQDDQVPHSPTSSNA